MNVNKYGNGININNPSFVEILNNDYMNDTLFSTQFNVLGSGQVHFLPNIWQHINTKFENLNFTTISGFKWPNRISYVPTNTIGMLKKSFIIPDGFLVPFHDDGGIYLCDDNLKIHRLDEEKSGWFYHMVEFRDIDGDGKIDILTARATKPFLENGKGELVYLKQPDVWTNTPWKTITITSGPDVLFTIINSTKSNSGAFTLVAGQFFTSRVVAYNINSTGSLINNQIIDENSGPAYKVVYIDINGDGVKDLLVNNHVGGSGGDIYAYDGTTNFQKRYTLMSNVFKVVVSGPGAASPGLIYPFYANNDHKRPSIVIAGDGSGRAYLMQPTNENEWSYNIEAFFNVSKTVGSIGINYSKEHNYCFVPAYENNFIQPYELLNL